jgi:hypothetical protein
MDQIDNFKSSRLEGQRTLGEYISGRALNSGLENTRTNQTVSAPLASESVLVSNSDAVTLSTPWSQLLLDLGITPTDKPPTW